MDADAVGGILDADAGGDQRSPISPLRGVALVAQARHELRPSRGDFLTAPSGPRGFVRKPVARKGGAHDVKRVFGITAVCGRIGQRLDHLVKLYERSRPS